MPILIEACCGSIDEAIAAQDAGADRIELCAGLPTGGVTPSLGMIRQAKKLLSIPVVVMVRSKEGAVCPSEAEFQTMLEDIRCSVSEGADQLIFGCLTPDCHVDEVRSREMLVTANGIPCAFHRVFDQTPNISVSLETLIELGFCRVLTSGGPFTTVNDGLSGLKNLVSQAKDRITILPGGGVRAHNVEALAGECGCREVHFSFRKPSGGIGYGGVVDQAPDPSQITEVRKLLEKFI